MRIKTSILRTNIWVLGKFLKNYRDIEIGTNKGDRRKSWTIYNEESLDSGKVSFLGL